MRGGEFRVFAPMRGPLVENPQTFDVDADLRGEAQSLDPGGERWVRVVYTDGPMPKGVDLMRVISGWPTMRYGYAKSVAESLRKRGYGTVLVRRNPMERE